MRFYETSAKDNLGVNDTFYSIAKEIKDRILTKTSHTDDGTRGGNNNMGTTKLNSTQTNQTSKGGCCG